MRLPASEIHVLQGKLTNSLDFQVTSWLLFSALCVTKTTLILILFQFVNFFNHLLHCNDDTLTVLCFSLLEYKCDIKVL